MATLSTGVSNSDVTFITSDGTEFVIGDYALIESEIVYISNVVSNTLTVVRPTTGNVAHLSGVTIMPYFNFKVKRQRDKNIKWINRTIEYETGAVQTQGVTVNPIITWQLTLSGVGTEYDRACNFFNARKGSRKYFMWKDDANAFHKVKFVNDELPLKQKNIETNSDGSFTLGAYEVTVSFRKFY